MNADEPFPTDLPSGSPDQRLFAARTRLLLDWPFLGVLSLKLEFREASDWCQTTATDLKHLYFNPDYIDALQRDELLFVLGHETLHCALSHFTRREHRITHRWDLACDYAINPVLVDEGFQPPPGIHILDEYRDMTAEEIYPHLDDNDMSETMDMHLYPRSSSSTDATPEKDDSDSNKENPGPADNTTSANKEQKSDTGTSSEESVDRAPPVTPDDLDYRDQAWKIHLASARQQHAAASISGPLARLLERQSRARVPWRQVLAAHMHRHARDNYSWSRPSARRAPPALYPSLKSEFLSVVIALDVSGSVSDEMIARFIDEVSALKGMVSASVTVICADSDIVQGYPQHYDPWETIETPKRLHGGGTTDFRPVFKWVDGQDTQPAVIIYLTDAAGVFPEKPPGCPVLWLITDTTTCASNQASGAQARAAIPWGQVVTLDY